MTQWKPLYAYIKDVMKYFIETVMHSLLRLLILGESDIFRSDGKIIMYIFTVSLFHY